VESLEGRLLFSIADISSSYEAFLKLPGIVGSVTTASYTGDLAVNSFSLDASFSAAATGVASGARAAGTTTLDDFVFTVDSGTVTGNLLGDAASRANLGQVVLTLGTSGSGGFSPVETITFKKSMMAGDQFSYSTSGPGQDQVALSYKNFGIDYLPMLTTQNVVGTSTFVQETLPAVQSTTSSGSDYVLVGIPGLTGDSTLTGYARQILSDSFSFGVGQGGSANEQFSESAEGTAPQVFGKLGVGLGTTTADYLNESGTVPAIDFGLTMKKSVLLSDDLTYSDGNAPLQQVTLGANTVRINSLTGTDEYSQQLAVTSAPATAIAGQSLSPEIQVSVENSNEQLLDTNISTISLTITSGPAGGTLGGATSPSTIDGVATFSDLTFSAGGTYVLQATEPGRVVSLNPITVTSADVQVTKAVSATQGPWVAVSAGLNSDFRYGDNGAQAPTVFSEADGIDFAAGQSLTISYVSGLTEIYPNSIQSDANGDSSLTPLNGNGVGEISGAPSQYFNSSDYPAYLGELVGTFADSNGSIVGTTFNIGDSRTVTIPAGATQLQLGVNDNFYLQNSGSLQIEVTGAPAPS
jgi:type VI protein secretion system component Hcp